MKKNILLLIALVLVCISSAIEVDFDGVFRARAACYNDASEKDGGHVDNRVHLGLKSMLAENLKLRARFEIGNLRWGEEGASIATSGVNVKTHDLFIDYRIVSINSNLLVGQLYWSDRRGLILNDSFSGVLLKMDDLSGFKTEIAWIKAKENFNNVNDDRNIFFVNAQTETPLPMGVLAMYGRNDLTDKENISIMPNLTLSLNPVELNIVVFADYQMNPDPVDDVLGFGTATKGSVDLGLLKLGGDLLFAAKHGLSIVSPYYQNGLFIYGLGPHHDTVNLYWKNDGYFGNNDTFVSAVGFVRMPLSKSMTAFGAFGSILDTGMEANVGIEHILIPKTLSLSSYAAGGSHENGTKNYLFGTTLLATW